MVQRLAWVLILLAGFLPARGADQPAWQGTWSAVIGTGGGSGGGTVFAGTWNASPGPSKDTAGGAWSLRDQNGAELATGTWAAGKEGKFWKGTWQARRPSGQVYNGTWRAQPALSGAAPFNALFEAAISQAVSGTWRIGTLGGAWTIRAYTQK
jgi:hypothetical protein